MENEIGVDQEQVVIVQGLSSVDHEILEVGYFPDQIGIPKVGGIIANVRIVKAGAVKINMITHAFEFLKQPAGFFIVIIINQMEI